MSVTPLKKLKTVLKNFWNPHRYQKRAVNFILNNRYGALFLDPGLGKTSITLRAIKILLGSGKGKAVLLIAPLRVCYLVWPAEILKWTNFNRVSMTILHGPNKESKLGLKKDIFVINPEGVPWLYEQLFQIVTNGGEVPFDILWIDESTKYKNPTAKTRFGLMKDLVPLFRRRYIMTGTPVPRSMMDLWSQIYILDEGDSLGNNFYKFRRKFFNEEEWTKSWTIKKGAKKEIEKRIAHLVLEMSADDYLDLPEFIENDIHVEMSKKAIKQYKQLEKEFLVEFEKDDTIVSAGHAGSLFGKCHQMASGRVYEDIPEELSKEEIKEFKKRRKVLAIHKAKQEALMDLIDELNGKPLLIAFHFKHSLDALRQCLGRDLPYIGSGIPMPEAKRLEGLWNAGKLPVLAGHPVSMAHGLNMQASGEDICWYDLTPNLEDYIQFNKRLHRQGAKGKHIRAHRIITLETVDEAIAMTLNHRGNQQKSFRQAMKLYSEKLH